jgi:hypothetical protein
MVVAAPLPGWLECASSFGPHLNVSFFGNSSFLEPVWAHHSIPKPGSAMPQRGKLGIRFGIYFGTQGVEQKSRADFAPAIKLPLSKLTATDNIMLGNHGQ